MKVLVTGGAGFLGSHVADTLSQRGHAVVIFDTIPSPYLRPDQKMVVGDIMDPASIEAAIDGCSYVYHFAAIADIGDTISKPTEAVKINILGTAHILDAAREAKVDRFVLASSVYVYSEQGSFYRTSKQASEQLTLDFASRFGLRYTILRFGSLYGPRAGQKNAVHRMLVEALEQGTIRYQGTGDEVRDYIHVLDAAESAVDITSSEFENAILHLTGQERMTTRDMLSMMKEIFGGRVDLRFNEGDRPGHYVQTPYSYTPRLGRKIVRRTYIDLGLGLLQCIQEIDQDSDFEMSRKLEQPKA